MAEVTLIVSEVLLTVTGSQAGNKMGDGAAAVAPAGNPLTEMATSI